MTNFLGVGIPELLVILALTLIVVGPQRLPQVAMQLGRTVRDLRRFAGQFRREFLEEFSDVRAEWEMSQKEYEETRRQLLDAQKSVEVAAATTGDEVTRAVEDVNAALRGAVVDSPAALTEAEPPSPTETTPEPEPPSPAPRRHH